MMLLFIFISIFLQFKFIDAVALKANNEQNDFNDTTNQWFEGDLNIPVELILNHYNFTSLHEKEEMISRNLNRGNTSGLNETEIAQKKNRRKRGAGSSISLWPGGIVKYHIMSSISANGIENINAAMTHFEKNTCLKFLPARGDEDFIDFINSERGCYTTYIGRQGGRQIINLGSPGCERVEVIIHEIAHAIGFWHEQSRPDRDNYVKINWNRIEEGRQGQFWKRDSFDIDYQGSSYDYRSIMHYPKTAFSRPGCQTDGCVTISVSNPREYSRQRRPKLGSSHGLSPEDVIQTNRLYSCAESGVRGFLSVYIRQGKDLRQTDGWLDRPDPYVFVTAVDSQGRLHSHSTSTIQNTQNPLWNELLLLGVGDWQFFRLTAWDEDRRGKDRLTQTKTIPVTPGYHQNLKVCQNVECRNFIKVDYIMDTRTVRAGSLSINIRFARDLADTDPIWNQPDPYVYIEAIQSNAVSVARRTKTVSGTNNPTWNQIINFECRSWNSLIFLIKDDDWNADDLLSDKIWVFINPGHHSDNKLTSSKGGYLIYDYIFKADGNECSSSPCQNGGTCQDGCSTYSCTCRQGFIGPNCQYLAGNLKVIARHGQNLPDSDGWWNDSDPYMEVVAVDQFGQSVRMASRHVGGNHNPEWNQVLSLGYRAWRSFTVRVYDSDWDSDDPLSDQQTIQLSAHVSKFNLKHLCYRGFAVYDYSF